MSLNIEKYRKHLAPLKLGKEQEEKVIRFIYAIMGEFVSAAFGKHPVQQAVDEKNRKSLQEQNRVIDSRDRNSQNNKEPRS
ncbi:hypothetical protein SAMN05421690_1001115 [Nitrosomonas sp. Nm51]|nr:hypothetical protein SAMN05421690_1001115 [Nitrosomonas sp. Nm51]